MHAMCFWWPFRALSVAKCSVRGRPWDVGMPVPSGQASWRGAESGCARVSEGRACTQVWIFLARVRLSEWASEWVRCWGEDGRFCSRRGGACVRDVRATRTRVSESAGARVPDGTCDGSRWVGRAAPRDVAHCSSQGALSPQPWLSTAAFGPAPAHLRGAARTHHRMLERARERNHHHPRCEHHGPGTEAQQQRCEIALAGAASTDGGCWLARTHAALRCAIFMRNRMR